MRQSLQVAAVVVAGLASMATPKAITPQRSFPRWIVLSEEHRRQGALDAIAWVSKSVKRGFELEVAVRNPADRDAALEVEARPIDFAAKALRVSGRVPARAEALLTLPLRFDSEALWNAGTRAVELELRARADGVELPPWRLVLAHMLLGDHGFEDGRAGASRVYERCRGEAAERHRSQGAVESWATVAPHPGRAGLALVIALRRSPGGPSRVRVRSARWNDREAPRLPAAEEVDARLHLVVVSFPEAPASPRGVARVQLEVDGAAQPEWRFTCR